LHLQAEGFPIEIISRIMQEYAYIDFAKTASKIVLSSMNEITFQYKYVIMNYHGDIEHIRVLELNKEINRTIMGGINYLRPILLGEKLPNYK